MIVFKDKTYQFKEIEKKVLSGKINEDKEFIIEALRSCFFTEDGATIVDKNGVTIFANGAHKKIMQIDGHDIVGKRTEDLVKEGIFEQSASMLVLQSGKQENIVQTLPSGKTILVTATPIINEEGDIHRILNNVRDVPILQSLYEERMRQETLIKTYKSELAKRVMIEKKGFIAESSKMRSVVRFIERVANIDSNILITGESGTGKGVVARLIHDTGERRHKPMMSINCGAIPKDLLESELFGYSPGAFTGASREGKIGFFEAANGGVIFLDEIGELPLNLQPKLLSFLETGEIMRIGSTKPIKVNCRILAATNRDFKKMVATNEFREDLFYRLSVIPINIPPLRERQDDIIPLTIHFLKEMNKKNGTRKTISKEALQSMEKFSWKGNVRQLRNTVERLVVLSPDQEITEKDLPEEKDNVLCGEESIDNHNFPVSLPELVQRFEDVYIQNAMKEGGSLRKAAKLLGISTTTLFRKINRE